MTPRRYPFWSALWNGFYNREFYVHVVMRWRSAAYGWLAVVVALGLVPLVLALSAQLNVLKEREIPHLIAQMPVITIHNGAASSAGDRPVTLHDSEGEAVVMIDTGGMHTDPIEAGVLVLLTRDFVMYREGDREVRSQSLRDIKDTVLTGELAQEITDSIWPFLLPVSAVVLFAVFYLMGLVQLLFYALVGLVITRVLDMRVEFHALVQVAAVAMGAVALAGAAVSFTGYDVKAVISLVATVFYLWFGLKAARDWARGQQAEGGAR